MNNGTNKLPVDCPHCNQRFSISLPKVTIWNNLTVSVMSAPHEKPVKCICGKSFIVGFSPQQSIGWLIAPITDEQAAAMDGSRLIVPSSPPIKLY